MAFTMYKAGQGYWTRLLSAVAAGVLLVAGVGYIWDQVGTTNLGYTGSHELVISAEAIPTEIDGRLMALGLVDLKDPDLLTNDPNAPKPKAEPGLIVDKVADDSLVGRAGLIRNDRLLECQGRAVNDIQTLTAVVSQLKANESLTLSYERQQKIVIFLQAGIAVVLLGLGGPLIYRWVGTKPATADFLIATEGEMKKVNWPPKKEVIGSTWVVIICVALLVTLLFLADILFSTLFKLIGVLNV